MKLPRRQFIGSAVGLGALPLVNGLPSLIHPGSSAFASTPPRVSTSTPLIHNKRYEGIPLTVSALTPHASFRANSELLKTHTEEALNSGRFTRLRVRSGGHSYIGASVARQAYVINLDPFDQVELRPQDGTVVFAAGCKMPQVSQVLAAHGDTLFVPTGDCPTVGAGGFYIGGGVSMLSPAIGLAVDRVVEATIVTFALRGGRYRGEILTISPSTQADLFWAVLGGGGQFGLVTDFTVRYADLPASSIYSIRQEHASVGAYCDFTLDWLALCRQDSGLAGATSAKLQLSRHGVLSVSGITPDAAGDLQKLQDLASRHGCGFDHKKLTHKTMDQQLSGCDSPRACAEASEHLSPQYSSAKSTLLSPDWRPSREALTKMWQLVMSNTTAKDAYVQLMRWSGAMAMPNPAVSFPFRAHSFECQIVAYTDDLPTWRQHAAAFDPWVDATTNTLGERQAAYFNHCHADLAGNKELYFGSSWPRLQAMKALYDPSHLFDALTPADQA